MMRLSQGNAHERKTERESHDMMMNFTKLDQNYRPIMQGSVNVISTYTVVCIYVL